MPDYEMVGGLYLPAGTHSATGVPREFLDPLTEQWCSKLKAAAEAKETFNAIAKQCDSFFGKASGFMWKDDYRLKYIGQAVVPPKFQVTINKAFELVALFGPYLFWQYPQVHIESFAPIEVPIEALGDPNDPQVQQFYEQLQQQQRSEAAVQDLRNELMQRYLNYAQFEQPRGGLAKHVEVAITEALVKGRSCLWIEGYQFPGSGRHLTGRMWDSVDNLFIDPDCKCPLLSDAKWIARQHVEPTYEVERKFGLPSGSLQDYGQIESVDHMASDRAYYGLHERVNGKSCDMLVWYEIWSKAGVGTRLNHDDPRKTMMGEGIQQLFDEVVGDYAYLAISPKAPFPLNAPSWKFRDPKTNEPTGTDEEVKEMFQWRAPGYGPPFPCYLDDRWPVALLDFYPTYGSAWPIAPLAPALGELTVLNVLISAYTEQAYENRKTIIAYVESAAKKVKDAVQGSANPAFVAINETVHRNINEIIQYLQRPPMNRDLLEAIAFVSDMFDKRTGLTEFMYAMSSKQSRTARDVAAKEEKASIRPEKMSNDVASWLTESARLEKFLAGWTVQGQDIVPLLGAQGAQFWDQLIVNADPEVVVREMRATIQANDVRKPNKERLLANMREMLQFMVPMMQQYAQDTGDTAQLNSFIDLLGYSMEQDVTDWEFGQWRPQPDENAQAMAEMEMQDRQLELQLKQHEIELKQRDVELKDVETIRATIEAQGNQANVAQKQLELEFDAASSEQDLIQDQQKHEQELRQREVDHQQSMIHEEEDHELKMEHADDQNKAKLQAMRQQAQAKPAIATRRPAG